MDITLGWGEPLKQQKSSVITIGDGVKKIVSSFTSSWESSYNTVSYESASHSILYTPEQFWVGLFENIQGRGRRGQRDFTVNPAMSREEIKAAIRNR